MIKNNPIGHLKISSGNEDDILFSVGKYIDRGGKAYCVPLNLIKYVVSKEDNKLSDVIKGADVVIADGMSMVWFAGRLGYSEVCHMPGISLAEKIIACSGKKKWKIYFLGASPENIERALIRIREKHDDVCVAGYRDGYFGEEETEEIVREINSSRADVLMLGLGMPQKEYFIYDNRDKIEANFILPVGGSFDVWADVKKRSNERLQKMGLEWIFRSYYDKSKAINVIKCGMIFLKDFLFNKP